MGGAGFAGHIAFVFMIFIFPLVVGGGIALVSLSVWRRRVRRRGYSGLRVYLRELPQTDEQKLDATELALKGAVLCLLGVGFFPLLVIGLVPLYYGARKLLAIRLGLAGIEEEQ